MSKKFARALACFQRHAATMRELGYQHVSVQWNGNTFHVEGLAPPAEHKGDMLAVPSEREDEEEFDRLGRSGK